MEIEPKRTLADQWRTEGPEALFGQLARELRLARGWSQEELADQLATLGFQFHQTQIGKIESGSRPLRLNEAAALALVFGIPLSDLTKLVPPGQDSHIDERIAELHQALNVLSQKQQSSNNALTALEDSLRREREVGQGYQIERDRLIQELMNLYAQRRMSTGGSNPSMETDSYFLVSHFYGWTYGSSSKPSDRSSQYSYSLVIDQRVIFFGTSYRSEQEALLDVEILRNELPHLGLNASENPRNHFTSRRSSADGTYSASVIIGGRMVATGQKSYATEDDLLAILRRTKELGPGLAVLIQGEMDRTSEKNQSVTYWPVPPEAEVTYRLWCDDDHKYHYEGQYRPDPNKKNVRRAALGSYFKSRKLAYDELRKQYKRKPGQVNETGPDGATRPITSEFKEETS